MEDPIVSDVIIENRAGVGSVFHDDSMFGTGKKDDPLGVNRDKFLPQNDLLNFRNVGWGLSTLNIVAQNWRGVGMGGMTMLTMSGTYAGQFLSTSDNIDPDTGARYNTFDVCAMNSMGAASGFVCRLDEGELQGTVELFSPKELPVDDDNNFVASTHWVQKVLLGKGYLTNLASERFANTAVGIGYNAQIRDNYATAIGANSSATYQSTAIGYNARQTGHGGIQLGSGTNGSSDFYVALGVGSATNYKMLDSATGKIPVERLEQVVLVANTLPANPKWKQIIVWSGDDSYKIGCVYRYEIDEWTFVLTSQNGSGVLNSIDMSKFITGDWFGGDGTYYVYTYDNTVWYVRYVGGLTINLTPEQLDDYGIDLVYDNSSGDFNRFIFNVEQGNGNWVEIGAGAEIGNINAVLDAINGEVV